MAVAIHVKFRGIQPFEGAREIVQDTLAILEPQLPEGTRCHVTVERALDAQPGAAELGTSVHTRLHLLGTGLFVSTEAHGADPVAALRLAAARIESKLPPKQEARREPADLAV